MSLSTMRQELLGIPGTNFGLVTVKINEALAAIQDEQTWSFQLKEGGWLTSPVLGGSQATRFLSPGTISVYPYTTTITGDATASAAWMAVILNPPFLGQMQIRLPAYSLYNIIAVDPTNPNAIVLTIDRPWMEPRQTAGNYMIYQAYYPAPVGFKRWFAIRDTTNNNAMDWWTKTERDLAADDPQRTIFDQPYYVVPYEMDNRTGSTTRGQMLFELWPQPVSQLPYTFSCMCDWPALVNPNDVVPYPLTEEIVKLRAYEMLYMWKESQKGDDMQRGSGSNWQFLMQAARSEYDNRLKRIRIMDRHLVDLYFTKARTAPPFGGEPFATVNGMVNVGGFGG